MAPTRMADAEMRAPTIMPPPNVAAENVVAMSIGAVVVSDSLIVAFCAASCMPA